MNIQFLIVGQGLAGSLLAWELMNRKQRVFIADYATQTSASRVAAGLINPVSGQRLVKAPELDNCLPAAIDYYQRLTDRLGQTFYHARPMLRLFRSAAEQERYKNRCKDQAYREYLGDAFAAGESGQPVNDPLGGFYQTQTGYLATTTLLQSLQEFFTSQQVYSPARIDYSALRLAAGHVHWNDIVAEQVIFCEGAGAVNNPWFRWLPFQLSKGDIVTLRSSAQLPSAIINDGYWLLPMDLHTARVGATYHWQWSRDNDPEPDIQTLLAAFERMTGVTKDVRVIDHRTGLRPTTRDKQPFIGKHPNNTCLGIFNGFGSKGAMLIPYYCQRFADYLLNRQPLPGKVDITRFDQNPSMVTLVKRHLSEKLQQGDVVIDATVGNGFDTEFLARCVGYNGRVFGFDVQLTAIDRTAQRLRAAALDDRVILYHHSHEFMSQQVPAAYHCKINAIVFNLGYLPGHGTHSSERIITTEPATRNALADALRLLHPAGVLSVVIYPGHRGGSDELTAVRHWVEQLDPRRYSATWVGQHANSPKSGPVLLIIESQPVPNDV